MRPKALLELLRGEMTQEQFAAHVGVAQSAISEWGSEKRGPTKVNIKRLQDLYPEHHHTIADVFLSTAAERSA